MMYCDFRDKTTAVLRITEKQYYQEQIIENKNNLRKTWDIIKQVINENKNYKTCDKFTSGKAQLLIQKPLQTHLTTTLPMLGQLLLPKFQIKG